MSVNSRMSLHLQEVHKIPKGSKEYYQYLKEAIPFTKRPNMDDVHAERKREIIRKDLINECQEKSCLSDYEEQLFEDFYKFKVSVDGGFNEIKSVKQSVQEVRSIVKCTSSVQLCVLVDKDILREQFLEKYCVERKYKPGTIKRYLKALADFLDFLIVENKTIDGACPQDILRMKMRACQWNKSYNDALEEHNWVRQGEEVEMLVTPEHVNNFEQSEASREAKSLLEIFKKKNCIRNASRSEYTIVRDYIITEIAILSCHRSGVASNMLLSEVDRAAYSSESQRYTISVKKHKTSKSHGPALICMDVILFEQLKTFIMKIRSQIVCDVDNVFVSYYGKKMASGAISGQLNSIWQKAGVYGENVPPPKRNMSSNIFRKSGSTITEEHAPESGKFVASLLGHSEATSKRNYRLIEKQKYALKGTGQLHSLFRSKDTSRFVWSADMETELKEIFESNIKKKTISIEDVRSVSDSFNLLKELTERQILDQKVRSIYRYQNHVMPSSTVTRSGKSFSFFLCFS